MPSAPSRPCSAQPCSALVQGGGRCTAHRPQRGSSTAQGYGYRWRKQRTMILRQEPLCRHCTEEGRVVVATDVDHVIPRASGGSEQRANLQPLCHEHHALKTATEDGGYGRHPVRSAVAGQFTMPVTLVCGPPGSGKTSYVQQHAKWGDIIVDLDVLWAALTGQDMFDKPAGLLPLVCEARDAVIARLSQPCNVRHAWIIAGGAKHADRDHHVAAGARLVMLDVDAVECLRRISQDERRRDKWRLWQPLVERWWSEYER